MPLEKCRHEETGMQVLVGRFRGPSAPDRDGAGASLSILYGLRRKTNDAGGLPVGWARAAAASDTTDDRADINLSSLAGSVSAARYTLETPGAQSLEGRPKCLISAHVGVGGKAFA